MKKIKRQALSVLLTLAMLASLLPAGAVSALAAEGDPAAPATTSQFAGGTGTAEDPYEIATAEQLRDFAALVNSGHTTVSAKLTADIDLSTICGADVEGGTSWTPIGSGSNSYTGTFDGDGHSVSGLYIYTPNGANVGLFGYVGQSGSVKNLRVDGNVSGSEYVGGVVGRVFVGSITNCVNHAKVHSSGTAGGVVGENEGGRVTNCYNTGQVSGSNDVGGVVGFVNSSSTCKVEYCYNFGKVTGGTGGSVVGDNDGDADQVTSCYFLESTAESGIGEGYGSAEMLTAEQFKSSESFQGWDFDSTWTISAHFGRPMLVNNHEYEGTKDHPYKIFNLGQLKAFAALVNSGTQRDAHAILMNDIDLNPGVTLNEDGTVTGGTPEQWEPIGNSSRQYTGTFSGQNYTIGDLYINSSASSYVGLFGYVGSDGRVENLTVSGTVSGNDSDHIGGIVAYNNGTVENDSFSGIVSSVSGDNVGGIVGYNSNIVENCSFSGESTASGGDHDLAGIVGQNYSGNVSDCTNNGSVNGDDNVGGIVGNNTGGGMITSCVNTDSVSVTGNSYVGGIAGRNNSTIENCYNTGKVSGSGNNNRVGGIVGYNQDIITNCYNVGTVSGTTVGVIVGNNMDSATNCYYRQQDGLNGIGSGSGTVRNVEAKTGADFASGEVAWLLQNGQPAESGQVWGQTISANSLPALFALDDNAKTVYRVTFDYGASFNADNRRYVYRYGNNGTTVELPTSHPENTNQIFAGWYDNTDFSGETVSGSITVTGVKTYYAKWTASEYDVMLNTNNGTIAAGKDVKTYTYGIGATLPTEEDITKTGYSFDGWYDNAEFNGDPVTAISDTDTGNKEYWAKWTANEYDVTLNTNDGTIAEGKDVKNYTYGIGVTLPTEEDITKTGYSFDGWYDNAEFNGDPVTAISDTDTGDKEYWAKWTEATEPEPEPEPTPDPTPVDPTPTPEPEPDGPSTGDSDGWTDILDELADAEDGDTVTIDMGETTEVPAEIFEEIAGKDVDVIFDLGDVSWTVNGTDIPANADLTDLDLGVSMDTDGIPVNVINAITGEVGTVQITLAYDGAFGFTMTLTAPLGAEHAGYWANLYHYDEDAEAMTFESAALVDEDGNVQLPFSHASQFAIVLDDHSHASVSVSEIFTDVPANHWAIDAIQYVYDHDLMTGTSAAEFSPELATTRGMLVSILYRLEGNPDISEEILGYPYADVTADDWYSIPVYWARLHGIAAGFDDNTFHPNDPLTREQLASMLMNYARWKGQEVSARADLSHYSDADRIGSWASDTMRWAVACGLISGMTNDTLQPQGAATRAQLAAILQRFLAE